MIEGQLHVHVDEQNDHDENDYKVLALRHGIVEISLRKVCCSEL